MKKIFYFSVLCLSILYASDSDGQMLIATYAGNGTVGYSGDGGPATAAGLNGGTAPLALDDSGNLFIGQISRIRKVDVHTGLIATVAGTGVAGFGGDGGPAIAAQFGLIEALAVDTAGCLYVSDLGNGRIRKIDQWGIVSTIAGNGTIGYTGDGGPAIDAQIGSCKGIATDTQGNIYFVDVDRHVVRKIDRFGIISTIAGDGTVGSGGDGGPATAAQFSLMSGIATDKSQHIYICDWNRVRKIDPSGIITNFAGTTFGFSGDGGPATAAEFNAPTGIGTDTAGNVYMSDPQTHVVRKVDASGIITTVAGNGVSGSSGDGGPATAANLVYPNSVVVGKNGILFIYDQLNYRVRVLDHAPHFTGGASQTLKVCLPDPTVFIDTLMAVSDSDKGQRILWSILSPPVHGTLAVSDTLVSTGSTLIPSGLFYAPISGYAGVDSFRVRVTDGIFSDSTTILVSCPEAVASVAAAYSTTISPNPNNGQFTVLITSSTKEDVHYTLTDLTGRVVLKTTAATNKPASLHTGPGIYFLNVATANGVWSRKVVVY